MDVSSGIPDSDVGHVRRFELVVWAETAGSAWHAEVSTSDKQQPLRFARPMDLLVFLTRLCDTTPAASRGLR